MSGDPGLANDTCIFIEAIPGDGGTHAANDIWWLSSDIRLKGPQSGLDTADGGQTNHAQVRFHRKSAGSGCQFPGDENLTVQLWVANPSLVMSPAAPGSAKRVGFIGSPLLPEGSTATQQIQWTPRANLPADDPESAGAKCLVARCYPETLTPSSDSFFLPADQHVAQRNLVVIPTTTTAFSFRFNTVNPTKGLGPAFTDVKLRAGMDLAPKQFVKTAVLERLQQINGFQAFRSTRLPFGFKFDLSGLQASQIVDNSTGGGLIPQPPQATPTFEARIPLSAREVTQLTFLANLKGVQVGQACIFHLIQMSVTTPAVVQGGLTLVVLKL